MVTGLLPFHQDTLTAVTHSLYSSHLLVEYSIDLPSIYISIPIDINDHKYTFMYFFFLILFFGAPCALM